MALTKQTGALANAGHQAQSIASNLANIAANLHYTGGGGGWSDPVPRGNPAPSYPSSGGGSQGNFSSAGGAAAANHIITQARAQQQAKNVVFNNVARAAVQNALAVASGAQPGRTMPALPVPMSRFGNDAANRFTPEQESQLFDQQIQATRLGASQQGMPGVFMPDPVQQQRIAAINRQVEQMGQGFANPVPNQRLDLQQQVMAAYPQIPVDQIRTRTNQQLQATLDLASKPPAAATNAGAGEQIGGRETSPNPMTHSQPPKGPPPQPAYSPLPAWDTTRGAPVQSPYSPLPTGPAMVSAAFQDAMARGQAAPLRVQGGQMADGGGGFLDTAGNIVGGLWGGVKDLAGELKDATVGTYEAFIETPVGQRVAQALELLDRGRQENAENYGEMFTQWANGDTIAWTVGGVYNPLNDTAALPIIVIGEAWQQHDPNIKEEIRDVAANGYSSASYIKAVEASGMTLSEAGSEFTGDRAVWEFLMSQTNGLPAIVKYPLRMMIDTTIDPLTYLAGVGAAGKGARLAGVGLRTAEDATLGGRVLGGVLEGTGAAIEGLSKVPDLPVEGVVGISRGLGGKIGEVTGLLSPSTAGLRHEAEAEGAELVGAIANARESVPDVEMRTAFDAEAQGVVPTSGPELIETPVIRSETPTVTQQVGGEPTITRTTATATLDQPGVTRTVDETVASVTGATGTRYPTFESLRDAPGNTVASPSKLYTYNGQQIVIRSGVAPDGATFFSASPAKATKASQIVTADSYTDLLDALPEKFGGSHPTFNPGSTKRAGAAPRSERVSPRSLSEARDLENYLRAEGADEATIQSAVQDFLAARFADERDAAAATARPPITKVEREVAAAAGGTPETPRSSGASETVRAAENAKSKVGTGKMNRLNASERKSYGALAGAQDRYIRLAKEDAEGLPKQVNTILGAQKPGEHEFSPIYNGHRPLDQIVTKAIDSKDPVLMKKADQFVKKVDQAVEQHLRTDDFYKTWKNGGVPVRTYSPSGAFADDFFEAFRSLDPDADIYRLRVLANGLAKGTLDDIAELQFQMNHLFPMLMEDYADEFTLRGALGAVGRIESKDFKAESSKWLIREYLDTPDPAKADTILHTFLTGETETPVIADGVHKPYAHSIVPEHQAESIARLQEMRAQWRTIKRAEAVKDFAAVREQSDAPFRAADIPAQLEGGKKGISKQFAAAMRSTKHSVKATDEAVNVAIGEIRDAEIAHWLLTDNGRFSVQDARLADRPMPVDWRPPGYAGDKTVWNFKEALDWALNEQAKDPSFNYIKARNDISQYAHGLTPKRTAAELKAMRKAAEAQGIDPKLIVDGASAMERATATKAVRGLDAYLRQYRALRLFNPIIGMGNRIGDIAGNSISHLIGRDLRAALMQAPLTFTEAKAFRTLGRDPDKLLAEWVKDTPHMAETGMTYDPRVMGQVRLQEIDATTGLPPINAKAAGTPRAVRTAASAWSSPALKDMTTAGEMVGRKLAFDRVYTDTIRKEAFPAFKEYLDGRFPGQADQLMTGILESAQETGGKSWGGYFSAGDVGKVVDEDAARAWQRELNRAAVKGGDEANHLFFNGRMTNADEIARRVLTFHFWMTRATALYGRTVLRNPVLLSGLYRVYERAQEIAQEQQMPDWLRTMMKFYMIPGAGSGYAAMDPIGALFPTFFLDAYSQEGNKFQALQNLLLPPWSGALGALGLTQNVPDLTGTRSLERFVIDMGNFLKGEGVDLEAIPLFGQYINTDSLTFKIPTEEFTKKLIEAANNLVGQPLGDFKPFDRAANEHDQLYSIGEQVGQGLWGEDISQWSEAQVAELTAAVEQAQYGNGEETWLSETIRATYGREGAARAFGALAIPGGVVTRQGFRDSQIEASHDYWDDFYAGKPTTKAGESAAAGRQLATSAQPVWVAMNNDYYQIGTKQEQTIYSSVNDMLYSPGDLNPHQSIIIDNGNGMFTVYSMSQLAALSDDDRQQVVYAWLDQNGGVQDAFTKVKDGRAAFKDEHPDYAQYSEYQKGVFGYQGGPSQFRKDMQDNPTFKAAEDAERERLRQEGKTGKVAEAELDHWATTQAAFFAATGQKYKTTDTVKGTPGPSSVAAMFSLRPDEETKSSGTKTTEKKDPTVDDYWSPAKGVPRLAQDQAQYDYDNAEMERRFGPYWNETTAEWEDNADSAKERDNLGIGDKTYVLPSVSETMRRYEVWEEEHPGGSPEEFFAEMLQTEGFGKKVGGASTPTLPGGTVITKPAGVAAYPSTAAGQLLAASQSIGVRAEPPVKPATKSVASTAPKPGKAAITGGKVYPLSQGYGMTDFAASQIGPGGMYEYTSQYTPDGSYVGHMGLDIGVPLGTPLYAPVSGTVVQAGGVPFEYDDRYRDADGNALPNTGGLRIELPNGDIVVMAHMQQITVNVGDTVTAGQPVGYSGESGADPSDPGSGAHVHVEYRQYAPGQTGSGYLAIDPRTKLDLGV